MEIRIIGASHAGIACALRAREENPDSNIVIYEKQKSIGFVAQSIPLYLAGDSNFLKLSSYTTIAELEAKHITVKTQTVIDSVDLSNKTIHYVDMVYDVEKEDHFDKLVVATGSYPSLSLVQDGFVDKLYVIKKFEDAVKIRQLMAESRSCIVIGGGAIGIEMAKILSELKIETTIIHSSDFILNRYLDKEIALDMQNALVENGVKIITNTLITSIDEENLKDSNRKISHVRTADGQHFEADGIIYATGFRPNSFLVADQVALGDRGAIIVDDYMQTSHPDVYAVGDCATTKLTNVKEPTYVPHASDAIRQGDVAGANLAGNTVQLKYSQGTYKLNFDRDISLCMSGLTHEKAKQEGFDSDVVTIRDQYVNGNAFFEAYLVYEKVTHKILGIQCKGSSFEVGAQAEIISLAIQNNLTVEDLQYSDFYFKHGFNNPKSFTQILADAIRQKEKSVK
ncbi:MAG: FAD-dependent oxidoreductase [Leuconostoc falkenbergense]